MPFHVDAASVGDGSISPISFAVTFNTDKDGS